MPLESELREGIRLIFVLVSIAHAYRSFWIRMGLGRLWGLCLIGTIGTFGNLSSAKRVSLNGKV